MSVFICPLCGNKLECQSGALKCGAGHSFDVSKRGYVNLLPPKFHTPGDNKLMVAARREFLSADYYAPLARAAADRLYGLSVVIDAGCGEGYYTEKLECGLIAALDISKDALYAAGARKYASPAELAVASIFKLPVSDGAADGIVSIFAPLCPEEFLRVLKPGGHLVIAAPGAGHLAQLKRVLYDEPYPNDETLQDMPGFRRVETERVKYDFRCCHLRQLFMMTPYAYRTPEEGRRRLDALDALEITADFLLYEFERI